MYIFIYMYEYIYIYIHIHIYIYIHSAERRSKLESPAQAPGERRFDSPAQEAQAPEAQRVGRRRRPGQRFA